MATTINITKLIPADYNPRDITKNNYAKLKASIQTYGILQPLIINTNGSRRNVIIGGHQRYKIAKEIGLKEVPVKYLNLNLKRERKLNLSLNKNTGHWDKDILANKFEIENLLDIGFTEFELGINDFIESKYETFTTKLTKAEYKKTSQVLRKIMKVKQYNEAEALMYIIHNFWKGITLDEDKLKIVEKYYINDEKDNTGISFRE
jgi:hypothetical protein